MKVLRKIELTTLEDLPTRIENIRVSFERLYGTKLGVEFRPLPIKSLCPTENFLERDKLALIFMKIVNEGYRVPIISVRKGGEYYIVDGHHRSYILAKMMEEMVESYVLRFPEEVSYRAPPKRSIENLLIIDPAPIDDLILKAWSQIITLLRYYEAIYNVSFYMRVENIPIENIVPTQPQVSKRQIISISKLLVPIVCVKYEGKYYVLDGHARTLRAKEIGLRFIKAILLIPKASVEYGIVRTVERLGLKNINDIKIVE
ncbi:MAG: ParB N-terminal domain-containing protein [Candidatus Bathyarchaeia archaeon]|nr:ParB N-terminal domain-containing protein [Candidatus Bathyarchaeota archaeon]